MLNTYTTEIHIAKGLTSSTKENYTLNENSRVVYLNANTGNDDSGSNENAFFNGGESCRGLDIQTSTPIILKNIKITGNAGGLSVCADSTVAGNVEIADGVLITGCSVTENGGGVYIAEGSTVKMSGGVIENNYADKGGGIFLSIGCNLIMTGGTISGNTAKSQGGAIFMNYTNPSPNDTGSNNMAKLQIGGSAYIPYGGEGKTMTYISKDTFALTNSGYYIDSDGYIKAQ